MQKLHFVAQGAALAKTMEMSIVVDWWCGFAAPCLSLAALFLAPRRRRARGWPLLACRLVGVTVTRTAQIVTPQRDTAVVLRYQCVGRPAGSWGAARTFLVRFVKPLIASAYRDSRVMLVCHA